MTYDLDFDFYALIPLFFHIFQFSYWEHHSILETFPSLIHFLPELLCYLLLFLL